MKHDDPVGEEIPPDEELLIQAFIVERVLHQEYQGGTNLRFPGSQPVSLAKSNIDLLNKQRYWVTWKVGFLCLHCTICPPAARLDK